MHRQFTIQSVAHHVRVLSNGKRTLTMQRDFRFACASQRKAGVSNATSLIDIQTQNALLKHWKSFDIATID